MKVKKLMKTIGKFQELKMYHNEKLMYHGYTGTFNNVVLEESKVVSVQASDNRILVINVQ